MYWWRVIAVIFFLPLWYLTGMLHMMQYGVPSQDKLHQISHNLMPFQILSSKICKKKLIAKTTSESATTFCKNYQNTELSNTCFEI